MLHVVGLGVAEQAELSATAQQAIGNSAVVIGAARQLETVAHYVAGKIPTQKLPPLQQLPELLAQYDGQDVCLLASGDPLYYGCLLYTSPSPRDLSTSRMPSSA